MNRFLSIFISIVGLIVVVVFSMNSVLFITHPDLSYGTENMFHISIIFMLFALATLFFLSKLNTDYINKSLESDQSAMHLLLKHDIVLINLISASTLILYLITNDIRLAIPILVVILVMFFLTLIWSLLIFWLHSKKDGSKNILLPNFISNIIFSSLTIYLFIELFLYFNLD